MRVVYDIMIFFAVLFTSFWWVLMLSILGSILFSWWYEIIAVFVLFELLFRGSMTLPGTLFFLAPFSLYALIFLLCIEWVRKHIRRKMP